MIWVVHKILQTNNIFEDQLNLSNNILRRQQPLTSNNSAFHKVRSKFKYLEYYESIVIIKILDISIKSLESLPL